MMLAPPVSSLSFSVLTAKYGERYTKVFFLPDVCLELVDLRLFEWVVVDVFSVLCEMFAQCRL
jgi:hypothetical protein